MGQIKPVGHLKTTKQGKTHLPNLIRREIGVEYGGEIPYVINASAVLLYDSKLSMEELLASIDVLKQDVKLRKRKENDKE